MPLVSQGSDLHPAGRYEAAQIIAIELPCDAEGNRRDSPFGPWLRVVFQTDWGTVATMVSPAYVRGSDLWHLAMQLPGDEMPKELDTDSLVGLAVPIFVRRQREHGAMMAVAQIIHAR